MAFDDPHFGAALLRHPGLAHLAKRRAFDRRVAHALGDKKIGNRLDPQHQPPRRLVIDDDLRKQAAGVLPDHARPHVPNARTPPFRAARPSPSPAAGRGDRSSRSIASRFLRAIFVQTAGRRDIGRRTRRKSRSTNSAAWGCGCHENCSTVWPIVSLCMIHWESVELYASLAGADSLLRPARAPA